MSVNSKAKRDRKKKQQKNNQNKKAPRSGAKLAPAQVQALFSSLQSQWGQLFEGMTTPSALSEGIKAFCAQLSAAAPIYLQCDPEPWSRQSCCDLNVLKYIEQCGGEMLCGYRIWAAGSRYVEAERHAVWTDGRTIRDVSFVDSGEGQTLFLPDDPASEVSFGGAPQKIRHAFSEEDQKLVEAFEAMQPPIQLMSDSEAWETMLTYERWRSGERMLNIIPSI